MALDRGDAPLAIAELEIAAKLLPLASEIQNHLGIAYGMDGQQAAALAAFQRAVELDCDNQAAQRNLSETEALAMVAPHSVRSVGAIETREPK